MTIERETGTRGQEDEYRNYAGNPEGRRLLGRTRT